jgi:CheY-like chemotaxis protein
MQEAQKMESLGILAGGIAHDFNNLLVGIVGNADFALLSEPADSAIRGSLEDIVDASHRAAELTNQMLAYSGKGRFVVGSIDLAQLVADTSRLLEAVISKNARLELDLEKVPAVEGDATQLRQVVMNLITNGSDALEGGRGTVRLSTRLVDADSQMLSRFHFGETLTEGSYVCFEVTDSGSGMDEATVARIFDPFFTTKFTGRGLGLAAALGIVRAHRGAIEVQSQPGLGTTFRLLLPPVVDELGVRPQSAAPAGEGWHGSGLVLVVDDEPPVLRVLKRLLEQGGFDVLTAGSGREALERFPEHAEKIVAVILDMTMPELDGEETFMALRDLDAGVPIILASGYSESEVRSGFAGDGPNGFLQKPFTSESLVTALRQVLAPVEADCGG